MLNHAARAALFNQGDPTEVFELLVKVGSGSYGDVYKARVRASGKMAAVKVIIMEQGEDIHDVLNEVDILRECNHKNIVGYFGCFTKRGSIRGDESIWIGMEYCGGGSVESIYKVLRKPYAEKEIAAVMYEALQGLDYLHEKKKIHRDIKGGNLLLTEDGALKLADFGVSAQLTKTLSRRNTVIGSPYWMAPEVITSEQTNTMYNEVADIWSLGITAIEMAELAPPLYDIHPMRALFMIPKIKTPTLQHKSKWSSAFHKFIESCLQKNPKKRPSAKDLLSHNFFKPFKTSQTGPVLADLVDRYLKQKGEAKKEEFHSDDEDSSPKKPLPRSGSIGAAISSPSVGGGSQSSMYGTPIGYNTTGTAVRYPGQPPVAGGNDGIPQELISQLAAMGFPPESCKTALQRNNNNVSAAADWLITNPPDAYAPDDIVNSYMDEPAVSAEDMMKRESQLRQDEEFARQLVKEQDSVDNQSFFMTKLCRIKKELNCSDYIEEQKVLLLGMEDGLVFVAGEANHQTMGYISSRIYKKLICIPELSLTVSVSGSRKPNVCIHELRGLSLPDVKNFETESNLKKIANTKGVLDIKIQRVRNAIYLICIKPKAVLITKWAPHPYRKFMELKEIELDFTPESAAVFEISAIDLRLFVSSPGGFALYDLESEDCSKSFTQDKSGPIVKHSKPKGDKVGKAVVYLAQNQYMMVYETFGVLVDGAGTLGEVRMRFPKKITFAAAFGTDALITVNINKEAEIWSTRTGMLLHTYGGKKNIYPLRDATYARFLLATVEEKDGKEATTIVSVLNKTPGAEKKTSRRA